MRDYGGFSLYNYTYLYFLTLGILRWASVFLFGPTPNAGKMKYGSVSQKLTQNMSIKFNMVETLVPRTP